MSEKKKVLLVEDTPAISKLTCFRLEKAGFEVITAMDGLAALEAVKNNLPDIILLDCGLPGIDGGEVIRRLKADERFKKIPVVIFTATIENVNYSRQFGADDAIAKPYEPEELIAKIKNILPS
jgi:DNA-binding response OmpR family regulator